MTDEQIRKGREWLAYLDSQKPQPEAARTIETATRRIPGSARGRIEAERVATPAPMLFLNVEDANDLVRHAERGQNPVIRSTVVTARDHFMPYPYAAYPEYAPDLVEV